MCRTPEYSKSEERGDCKKLEAATKGKVEEELLEEEEEEEKEGQSELRGEVSIIKLIM